MPKLSVVMPVYNAEALLAEAMDSVLTQSLEDLELIVVDDGSTDESLSVARRRAARDARVTVITQPNRHAGPARNAGLMAATGEYVHFLDADDAVLPFAYETLYNKAAKHRLDHLRCAAVVYNVADARYEDRVFDCQRNLAPGDFMRLVGPGPESPLFKVSAAPWAGIYRRAFLLERGIRFNDLLCANDRSFYAAVITCAERQMVCRDRAVLHRVGQAGSLVGGKAAHFECVLESIACVVERLAADAVPLEVQERVLRAEFADFALWFRTCAAQPEHAARVREQTAEFVAGYTGPYRHLLVAAWRDAEKRVDAQARPPRRPRRAKPYHKACKAPKVSVVVPVYNVEDYLDEALHSLSAQRMEELEFVLVNDGSTDGSLAIMRAHAALDKRFCILDGPNGGYGRAMNRGIDAARGRYIGILEPDDFVPPEMFGELYEAAEAAQADLVKADSYRFKTKPDGSLDLKLNRLNAADDLYNRVLCPAEEQRVFKLPKYTWSGIYRTEFIRRHGIRHNETPGASYQNNGFWFQTFCRAERALFVDRAYYRYRRDRPDASMADRGKMYCASAEFDFIQRFLEGEPGLFERFASTFYAQKFNAMAVTYNRLVEERQLEYLRHIQAEFAAPLATGLVHEADMMSAQQWLQLNEIVADPEEYFNRLAVSVVMPIYNAEPYLRETLDGLLCRNEIRFEVICVDDGSTDGTLGILREYEAADARVRVVHQENAGAGAARNAGLRLARGEYLSFLDADDIFEPDMLRKAYQQAHALDADLTVYRCDRYVQATGETISSRHTIKAALLPAARPFAAQDIKQDLFGVFMCWAWDKLFRTSYIRGLGLEFQEQRVANDLLFVLAATARAERISIVSEVLIHHRKMEGTLSVKRGDEWGAFYTALLALRERLREWGVFEGREQDFANFALWFSLWNLASLEGPAYHELFDKLQGGWLRELGAAGQPADYFYRRDDAEQLQQLMGCTSEEFLFWQRDRAKTAQTREHQRVRALEEELATARADGGSAARARTRERGAARREARRLAAANEELAAANEELAAQVERLEEQNRQLADEGERQRAELGRLKAKNRRLRARLERLRASTSWRIGRAITWLPRTARQLARG